MRILRRELTAGFRSVAVWILIVVALNVLMIAIYPSFAVDQQAVQDIIKLFPPEMVKALGLDRLSLGDPIGYYATEVYLIVILVGGVFATLTGASILAKEEDERTAEFLLARPVARAQVIVEKAATVALFVLTFNVAVAVVNLAAFSAFVRQPYSWSMLLQLSVAPTFSQLALAGAAFLSALMWTRRRAVYSVSMGLALGTYSLGLASLLSRKLGWLRWISPYRYVEAVDIVTRPGINAGFALALLAAAGAGAAVTYWLYSRRDIAA